MKKILLVIDDEKREIEAEYFDLNLSSGIGEGYDAIFCVETKKEEPSLKVEGQVEHPTQNAILETSLPATMSFQTIGLDDDLKMQRRILGLNDSLIIEKNAITQKEGYEVEGYNIQIPGILHTAVLALVEWEKEKTQGKPFYVSLEPVLVFTNSEKTQFKVREVLIIQTGIVQPTTTVT
jgi:hypothetical protein